MIETIPHRATSETAKTYRKGRRCNVCSAYLSQYNRYNRCWAHRPEGRELAPLDKPSQQAEFIETIRELMEQET